jgi:uncharacterized phage-associated protein
MSLMRDRPPSQSSDLIDRYFHTFSHRRREVGALPQNHADSQGRPIAITSARAVANEFIRLAREDGRALTPLQIIKLVYIAHGWMLALHQRPLITDRIEAWKYGPVIPSLYHDLKHYGGGSVREPLSSFLHIRSLPDLNEDDRDVICQVYNAYGKQTGIQLSALTHRRGTPWADTWSPDSIGLAISNDLIADHHRQLANERGVTKK